MGYTQKDTYKYHMKRPIQRLLVISENQELSLF